MWVQDELKTNNLRYINSSLKNQIPHCTELPALPVLFSDIFICGTFAKILSPQEAGLPAAPPPQAARLRSPALCGRLHLPLLGHWGLGVHMARC